MNADIRIYPAAELSALDMAELMNAALLNDGILQGCGLSVSSNELHIASGRMVIKGRLAVVTAGAIERPEDVLSRQTCHVCAICDLNADTPFTIENLKQGDYDELVSRASGYTGDTFNVNNGVAILELGTTVVDPSEGVVSVAAASGLSGKNATKVNALTETITRNASSATTQINGVKTELNNTINTKINTVNSTINTVKDSGNATVSLATLNSWVNYLKKRAFAINKWHFENRDFDGVVIGGNKIVTVRFPSTWYFNRVMIDFASSNSTQAAATAANDAMEYIIQAKQQAMANKRLWSGIACYNDGVVIAKEKYTPSLSIPNDKYGVPTDINPNYYPVGPIAIVINNASSGGANYGNCLIQTFGWDGDNFFYVRIRNVGSGQAKVNVIARIAYVQGM